MAFQSGATLVVEPQKAQAVTADSYNGQLVTYQSGDKIIKHHYKPRQEFYRQGGRAIILGNGLTRQRLPIIDINRSNANKKLPVYNIIYACNAAYIEPGEIDFLVVTNKLLASKIPKKLHPSTYAPQEIQRINPNMELIPLLQRLDAGSAAVMLACFHGADKVFLLGFDGQDSKNKNNNIYANSQFYDSEFTPIDDKQWHENLLMVMSAYPHVQFYRIDSNPISSRKLSKLKNYNLITFNEFVFMADI